MDRRENMLDAIGEVGSDLIVQAETKRFAPGPLRRWGGLAAALVLVIGLTALALPWLQNNDEASNALSSTESDTAVGTDTPTDTDTETAIDPMTDDTAEDTASPDEAADDPELELNTEDIPEGEEEDPVDSIQVQDSWTLSLPTYEDAQELWYSGRGDQLISNFVTTLELGWNGFNDPILNFEDPEELSSQALLRFFLLILNQQKGNGWYNGPSYETRWFEAQADLPADSPYAALGGWYDIPVDELQATLSCWLPSYQFSPEELSNYVPEENVIRLETVYLQEKEGFLQLEAAEFDDENQTMALTVTRFSDSEMQWPIVSRVYVLHFERGMVNYVSILQD